MSNVILKIDGVDVSEYFMGPLRVNPGGDGVIGNATIYLNQEAGGLDIRTMQDVQVYVPFNTTTNAGIASKGRLFGGHIMKRGTTNIGTTKLWTLSCADYNVILKKSYRRAAPVYAVTISADTLDQQIIELFGILQGASPGVQLDVVSGIALTTLCPGATFPGGHTWGWYLEQLLTACHIEDPAVFPAYYLATDTTFGALDVFGPPVLNVYDAASPPASTVTFSDTPTGAEKSVFEYLTRDTDATALNQTQQSWWNGLVFSAQDSTSISNYPNPYDDYGQGWVDGEVINDTTSGSSDEAQALVDAVILAKGSPRDGFKWVTYERLMPGEYVDLEWSLEGIPPGTQYRVAAATFEWEEPNVIKTTLTLNTRRLGLFDDGLEGYFAAPIEGDDVPPNPPADFDVTTNVYNFITRQSDLTFDIDNTGASPDTAGYRIRGIVGGSELLNIDVGLDLTPTLSFRPNFSYSFRVWAYDYNGNESESFPAPADPAITGTTAGPPWHENVPNPSYELDAFIETQPLYWTNLDQENGVSTREIIDTPYGSHMLQLACFGDPDDKASRQSEYFLPTASDTNTYVLDLYAVADTSKSLLWTVVSATYDGTSFTSIGGDTGFFSVTTTPGRKRAVITPDVVGGYLSIRVTNSVDDTIWVDDVRMVPQIITDVYEDESITLAKLDPALAAMIGGGGGSDVTAFHQGGDAFGATAEIGTTDAEDVSIIANGTERINVSSTGNIYMQNVDDTIAGSMLEVYVTPDVTGGESTAIYGSTIIYDTGTQGKLTGIRGKAGVTVATSVDVSQANGVVGEVAHAGSGTITEAASVRGRLISDTGAGDVETAISIYGEAQTVGTVSNYAGFFNGYVEVTGDLGVTGNLDVTGDVDVTGNLTSPATNVLGSALTDPATDGYLYIPSIDAPPSGTPTTHAGTNAMCYCDATRSLYIYDNALVGWRSVTLT